MNTGIVSTEHSVDSDTSSTDSAVSPSCRAANIVVAVAVEQLVAVLARHAVSLPDHVGRIGGQKFFLGQLHQMAFDLSRCR